MAAVETLLANHSPQEYTVLSALSSASYGGIHVQCCMYYDGCMCTCMCVCVSGTHKVDLQPIKSVCLHPHTELDHNQLLLPSPCMLTLHTCTHACISFCG